MTIKNNYRNAITLEFYGQQLCSLYDVDVFIIRTDGAHAGRLVDRGDVMEAFIDFNPGAVNYGNVSLRSIEM